MAIDVDIGGNASENTLTFTVGEAKLVQGPQGEQGKSVESATVNGNGHLVLTIYDPATETRETYDAGVTIGPRGEKGDKGDTGPQGPKGPKGDPGSGGGGFYVGDEEPEDTNLLWIDPDDGDDDGASYDMVLDIHTNPMASLSDSASYVSTIVSGSVASVISKLDTNPDYIPKILVKWRVYYGVMLTTRNEVMNPWVFYGINDTELDLTTQWMWCTEHLGVTISSSGQVTVVMRS